MFAGEDFGSLGCAQGGTLLRRTNIDRWNVMAEARLVSVVQQMCPKMRKSQAKIVTCTGNEAFKPAHNGTRLILRACRRSAKRSWLTGQHKCHIQGMENVTLTPKEQTRLQVLNSLLAEHITLEQAATLMGVGERHTRRILAAYREEGAAAPSHGNRGRQPRNAVPEDVAAAVVILASGKYAGFNHSHLTEVLAEREGIHLSRQTVSRLLNRHGLTSARRHRPPKHRVRRERMPHEGMLLQVDGSHHPWLEERGPRFVLLLAVVDATGMVANAVFHPEEDTRGYFLLLDGVIQHYGIPLALYGDRHGVFKFAGKPRHIQPPVEATHFSRALQELFNAQFFARSPQAKGRVERMAGTFQYRLVSELRLAAPPPSTRPTPCCGDSCPGSTSSSVCPPSSPRWPIAP